MTVARSRLYDITAAAARVGTGWVFSEHALGMQGGEEPLAAQLSRLGVPRPGLTASVLPYLELACALAFAVGLLTWAVGPLLAFAAVGGLAAVGPSVHTGPDVSPPVLVLIAAVCLLLSLRPGRWSWDYLVLSSRPGPRRGRAHSSVARERPSPPAFSPRRPEQAPPLLYPEGQAALRRPSRT